MHIALATCANLPDWEVDDCPFHEALRRRGVDFDHVPWSDGDIDWARFDACLIRTTWDYQDRHAEFLNWAERIDTLTRLFNPLSIVRWNTHKSYLRDLAERGVPTVETIWLETGGNADVRTLVDERGWRKAFLKPAIGATARETLPFDATSEGIAAAQAHLDRLLPREDMLLQPFLESVLTEGERSAIFIDGKITHTVRKIPVPGDYRVQDDFGARDEPSPLSDEETRIAEHAMRAIGADLLYGRTDFLRDDDGRLRLTEMELVEPSMFFRHGPGAAERFAEALCRRVKQAADESETPDEQHQH